MTLAVLLLFAAASAPLDLTQVKAEPDFGKRAARAIDYADQQLVEARRFAKENDLAKMKEAAEDAAQGTELALETFKTKRNIGRQKKAEMRCREFLRRLETLELDLPVEDRSVVQAVVSRIRSVHEELLTLTLEKKK